MTEQIEDERTINRLVGDLSTQVGRLVRDELSLAQLELKRTGRRVGAGAGLFGAAGVLATYGGAALVAAAVAGLALVVDVWLAALGVGVVVLVVAGGLAVAGRAQLRRAGAPKQTAENVKEDIRTVKEHAR